MVAGTANLRTRRLIVGVLMFGFVMRCLCACETKRSAVGGRRHVSVMLVGSGSLHGGVMWTDVWAAAVMRTRSVLSCGEVPYERAPSRQWSYSKQDCYEHPRAPSGSTRCASMDTVRREHERWAVWYTVACAVCQICRRRQRSACGRACAGTKCHSRWHPYQAAVDDSVVDSRLVIVEGCIRRSFFPPTILGGQDLNAPGSRLKSHWAREHRIASPKQVLRPRDLRGFSTLPTTIAATTDPVRMHCVALTSDYY